MTFFKTTLAATTALTLIAAPSLAQQTVSPSVTANGEASSTLLVEKDADDSVNSVGDALSATGDLAADTVGGAVNIAGDAVTATGNLVAGTGDAISGLLEGPGADVTTTATVYRIVPAAELDARIATGTPVVGLDNSSLIGEFVTTLDGTQIGRINSVERTEAGVLQTLSLDTAASDAEINLAAAATTKTEDGIILALTDAEFVAVVEAGEEG